MVIWRRENIHQHVNGTAPDMGIYAVYASRKQMSQAMRSMIDFLVARFGDNSQWD